VTPVAEAAGIDVAQAVDNWLAENERNGWTASTVHAQQGAEADFVIFDTVNAGSYLWPPHEWERIVNVALSRARELVIVLASRKEMQEIYLRRLKELLAPRVLTGSKRASWREVETDRSYAPPHATSRDAGLLGAQLAARKSMIPLLTREQERLCAFRRSRLAREWRSRRVAARAHRRASRERCAT
jgi:hypothetical protein